MRLRSHYCVPFYARLKPFDSFFLTLHNTTPISGASWLFLCIYKLRKTARSTGKNIPESRPIGQARINLDFLVSCFLSLSLSVLTEMRTIRGVTNLQQKQEVTTSKLRRTCGTGGAPWETSSSKHCGLVSEQSAWKPSRLTFRALKFLFE